MLHFLLLNGIMFLIAACAESCFGTAGMPHLNIRQSKLRILAKRPVVLLTLSFLLVVVLVATFLNAYKGGVSQAFTLATSHQSENYTELYFDNSSHLPLYSAANKLQHVSFHLANHEAQATSYSYTVTLYVGQVATRLAQGTTTLRDGQSIDVPFSYMLRTPNTAAQIFVRLTNRPEYITYRTKS